MKKVTLFKNLISSKWASASMERYALNLERSLELIGVPVRTVQPKIPFFLELLPSKINFYLSRYYYYPFLASFYKEGVNHIIDQSFAHLIYSLNKSKTVITCHDLIPLGREENEFALRMYKRSIEGLKSAAKIIADSHFSKESIIKELGIDERRIKVVYLGVEDKFKPTKEKSYLSEVRERYKIPKDKKVILHVGHNLAYKNVEKIIQALAILKMKGLDFLFLKVGPEFVLEQKTLIAEFGLEEKILRIDNISESELPLLYSLSSVLVYPSLIEGFGFPVLEAMSSGVPTVISKNGSLPEIGGEASLYVDSASREDIAEKLELVLKEEDLRSDLIKKGLEQAKKFTWEKTAQEVLEVYKQVEND